MSRIEDQLSARGLVLPPLLQPPTGTVFPFQAVRIVGSRALISGHGPQNADGSIVPTLGKVGQAVTREQGVVAARLTALSILGSLKRGWRPQPQRRGHGRAAV